MRQFVNWNTVADTALRMTLRSMLLDPAYTGAPTARAYVEGALHAGNTIWSDQDRQALFRYAMDWIHTQPASTALAMQKALGEEIPDEVGIVPPSQARLESTRQTLRTQMEQVMSVAEITEHENDLMTPEFDRELAIVSQEMQRPPFWFPDDTERLRKATALVAQGNVAARYDGTYDVKGSKGHTYTCASECPCPQGQKGKSKWCYHLIATVIQKEVEARLGGQASLFAPPKTIGERLAQQPQEIPMATTTTDTFIPEPDDIPEPDVPTSVQQAIAAPASPLALDIHPQHITHAGAVMHEAPYSATTNVEDAEGYQFLITVRRADGAEFFEALGKMRAWCKLEGLKPQPRRLGAPRSDVAPQATPTDIPKEPNAPQSPPMCPYHGAMKESAKAPGTYYCPKKMGDGQSYCRERWPKKAV